MGDITLRQLGLMDYQPVWHAMADYTDKRDEQAADELWLVQHPPVFTQGQAGKAEHVLMPGDIPVIQVDRGGQVTYHGPGQIIIYPLLDLRRRNLGVRDLVSAIEAAIVRCLAYYGLEAYPRADAPGVYIDGGKIASLGLRVRRGCSFHGLALNVDLDLEPFGRINPCGYQGLEMLRLKDLLDPCPSLEQVQQRLVQELMTGLAYSEASDVSGLPQPKIETPQ
ncbi:MAG: lipoyl(octanoyl) transferase LipB [Cellvibrionaceae bacterium]|nr:lipoyl(octanoyl) transferase LipB [Cellvibrionaceae bacterium]MCV6628047.1 lipoyl(octanoyl) transferase LipB [Cellvibrionaceae bacterium]